MTPQARILIIEDQAIVVKDLENKLTALGYEVVAHAASGLDAIKLAIEHQPDLVLMDIKLEGEPDGIEIARELKEKHTIPIIFVTAYSDDKTLERAREIKPLGFILKPFEMQELRSAIEIGLFKHTTEEQTRIEQQKLRQLADNLDDMLWICNADLSEVLYVNPAFERTFGSNFNMSQRDFIEIVIHEDDRARIIEHNGKLINGEIPDEYSIKHRIIRKDGAIRWVNNKGFAIRDADNKVIRRAGLVQDITESHELMRELQESEKKYRDLVDQSLQGLVIIQGDPPVVVYLNRRITEMLGYDFQMAYGKPLLPGDYIYQDDIDVIERLKKRLSGEDLPQGSELRLIHRDGSIRWMEIQASRITFRGAPAVQVAFVDTTERKTAEDALKVSEERLRLALDAASEGLWEWNLKTSRTYFSPRWFTMLGFEPDELPHHYETWRQLLHPDERDIAERFVDEKVKMGGDLCFEFRMRTKDDKWRWIEARGRAVEQDPDGTVTKLLGTHTDITQRKEAEIALRASEERFRSLFENTPIGIFRFIQDGTIIVANPAMIKMLDYNSLEGITNKNSTIDDLSVNHEQLSFGDYIARNETIDEKETEWRTATGNVISVRISARAIEDKDGNTLYWEGTVIDVSEKAKTEKALRDSEERFRRIIETSQTGYFRLDSRGKIIDVNRGWLNMHGYETPSEVIGKPYSIVHVQDEKEKAIEYNLKMLKGENIPSGEFKRVCKDGSIGYQTYSVKPVFKGGEIVGVEGFIIDTTAVKNAQEERKKLEMNLQQIQKQESLGVLAGGIAHDFNNLLQSILGNANLAIMDLPSDSQVKDCILEIEKEAKRAANLTQQMLAYSGRGKFEVIPLDVSELISDSRDILRIATSPDVNYQFNLVQNIPMINADPSQIQQVLLSLVTNASEAIKGKHGEIKISTGKRFCDSEFLSEVYMKENHREGDYVYFNITDNGAGMEPGMVERIFDPFFTTKFTGRGLGLAAVLGIVRGHNGAIQIQSEPGSGTSITVLFPVEELVPGDDSKPRPNVKELKGSRLILVVDDENSIVRLAQKILEQAGFEVICASDGLEAVDIYREKSEVIDLVMLDLSMPKMSGEEAATQMMKIKEDTLILIASGFSDREAIEQFGGRKVAGFIQKPYRPNELIKKIRELLI